MRATLTAVLLAGAAFSCAPALAAAPAADAGFGGARQAALASLRAWFLDAAASEPALAFSTGDAAAHGGDIAALRALADEARLLRAGRSASLDDPQSYAQMTALVARRLGVEPPEAALPVYLRRLRPAAPPLSPAERAVRDELAAAARAPGAGARYVVIPGLLGAPEPAAASTRPRVVYARARHGRRVRRLVRRPELAPPPRPVSVIARVDWDRADELAAVAEGNARGWQRVPGESPRRWRRRVRRLRAHCYAWVRRDLEALGIWDEGLFRDSVPPTRWDRRRPIRAASFALAMAKVTASRALTARTTLRELDPRVDPLVRGAIVVFSPRACSYSRRDGHIEVITSLAPLRAASFKFHPLEPGCLAAAAGANAVHVYVPVRAGSSELAAAEAGR